MDHTFLQQLSGLEELRDVILHPKNVSIRLSNEQVIRAILAKRQDCEAGRCEHCDGFFLELDVNASKANGFLVYKKARCQNPNRKVASLDALLEISGLPDFVLDQETPTGQVVNPRAIILPSDCGTLSSCAVAYFLTRSLIEEGIWTRYVWAPHFDRLHRQAEEFFTVYDAIVLDGYSAFDDPEWAVRAMLAFIARWLAIQNKRFYCVLDCSPLDLRERVPGEAHIIKMLRSLPPLEMKKRRGGRTCSTKLSASEYSE